MSKAERDARLTAAVYRVHGVDALWQPVGGGPALPVVVKRKLDDAAAPWGESVSLVRTNRLEVRLTEVPVASRDDEVTLGAETLRITGTPELKPGGLEWLCEAVAV